MLAEGPTEQRAKGASVNEIDEIEENCEAKSAHLMEECEADVMKEAQNGNDNSRITRRALDEGDDDALDEEVSHDVQLRAHAQALSKPSVIILR